MSTTENAPQRVTHVLGLVILAVAGLATLLHLWDPVGVYDEGLLLVDSRLMMRGVHPYADFYTNYPPGIFLVIAFIWRIFGDHAVLIRVLGIVLHFAIAALVGRLAGRVAGRRFLTFPAAIALAFLLSAGVVPYAYLAAVTCALTVIELGLLMADRGPTKVRALLAGFALGAVSAFRHDVFVYLCCGLGLLAIIALVRRKVAVNGPNAIHAACFVVGGLVPLALVWIPAFMHAGVRQVAADLYFDQVRWVLPARVTPLPRIFPDLFANSSAAAAVLVLTAPLVAIAAWKWIPDEKSRLAIVFVGIFAVLLLPQSLGRSDLIHLVYGLAPALVLAGGGLDRLARSASLARMRASCVGFAWLVVVVVPLFIGSYRAAREFVRADVSLWRSPPMVNAEVRREVLAFIASHSAPGEPIYVGVTDHRRVIISEVDLYYFADRPSGVRRMQFDPNMTTRAEEQQLAIAQLETKHVNVAVLSDACYWDEPNRSREWGAGDLDAYIHDHFSEERIVGPYHLLLRRH